MNWDGVANYVTVGSTVTNPALPVSAATITAVYPSSITVNWTSVPYVTGYAVDASTAPDFTGPLASSVTLNTLLSTLTQPGAWPSTPRTITARRRAATADSVTSYTLTAPASTSTLTNLVSGAQFTMVGSTAISVSWTSLGMGNAEGYKLQASSSPAFVYPVSSSTTYDVNVTTLQISGLIPQTTYYFNVGGLNWTYTPNYIFVGSTETAIVPTPTGLLGTAVGVSSISWAWGGVAGATLYHVFYASGTPRSIKALRIVFTKRDFATNIGLRCCRHGGNQWRAECLAPAAVTANVYDGGRSRNAHLQQCVLYVV